ncbi:MAG: patatin-like phospholipase family protein [Thiobacillus sp.]|nr:patatin-like phospholipase family protein [Thiobacillus sp.]
MGAGAISAGAYTGGVVDFMVHALDSWYAAKGKNALAPPHEVKLSVMSGASAGGITAALAAAYLGSDQPSIANEEAARANKGANKLFDSWVDRIDISSLLEHKDLPDKQTPVISLLDSSILSEIADSGLNVSPRATRRPYVAENFELLLTITNLRGVPYAFKVQSDQPARYDMSLHADYMHFRINDSGEDGLPDRYTMSWAEFGKPSSPLKEKIKVSALASGAFPIGLAPRTLDHVIPGNGQPDWYGSRLWPVPTPESDQPHQCVTHESISVNWGDLSPGYRFDFQCMDGGVMNNEPMELARQMLSGSGQRNFRLGERANKAVLLVDPFPSDTSFDSTHKAAPDLLTTAMKLFGALKNQARFKPDKLMLAAKDDVFSRFMIAPSRNGTANAIACGALGGFGGFLKRDFRSHDYFLGRRNAQKFFRDHFVLPETNPLFAEWTDGMKEAHWVRDDSGQPRKNEAGQRFLPIIPLVGEARPPCYKAEWPRYTTDDLAKLMERIESRVDVVLDHLVNQYFKSNNPFVRFVAKIVLGRKKKDVVALVQQKVTTDLEKMQLMR